MRLLVFYDLPFNNKINVREYNRFRKTLFSEGFNMIQYSIYSKICYNKDSLDYLINRIKKKLPKLGNIRLLSITEKQYQNIEIILGGKSDQEIITNDRRYIEI